MSVRVEHLTSEQAYDRLLANLEDAEMGVHDFLSLVKHACHIDCVRDWQDDRWDAIGEAEHYLFLLGGIEGLTRIWETRAEWGRTA